ncbi:response regulator transcription factor, partial [Thermodesulfitimonas sp.]
MHAEKEFGLAAAHLQTLVDSIQREFFYCRSCLSQRRQVDPIPAAPSRIPPEIAGKLTAREREVLELLLRGLGSKKIAVKLHLSVSTVEDYRKQIYQKLGVRGGIKGILALFSR